MRKTGEYVEISSAGVSARAFVPASLPPEPALSINAALRSRLDRSLLELGRLDTISALLPNPDLFLYS